MTEKPKDDLKALKRWLRAEIKYTEAQIKEFPNHAYTDCYIGQKVGYEEVLAWLMKRKKTIEALRGGKEVEKT